MKAAKKLIAALTTEQKESILQFDNETAATCSLYEFLKTNLLDENVDHITIDDAKKVINLKVGEECYLPAGFGTTVKRIAQPLPVMKMNFVQAGYDDKMSMYFDAKNIYEDEFPKVKVKDILFMYLDTDVEEENVVVIVRFGRDKYHIQWFDNETKDMMEKTGSLDYVKSFLEIVYNSIYSV
jgi:hypothetical protein